MKQTASLSLFAFLFVLSAHLWASGLRDEITLVDPATGSITVSNGQGGFHTYKTTPSTEITMNGERTTLNSLNAGMIASVTAGNPGVAARIVVTKGDLGAANPGAKTAPVELKINIPATAVRDKPVVVGRVSAGQKVTVIPTRVWWTGGGTKRGKYCDWNGYDKKIGGKRWMALVAAVGEAAFTPANNALSFTAPADGPLVLYANDDNPEGNEGNADVTVRITPP